MERLMMSPFKGSYVAGDLTFVRPPVNLEAPAAIWCPAGDGCTGK